MSSSLIVKEGLEEWTKSGSKTSSGGVDNIGRTKSIEQGKFVLLCNASWEKPCYSLTRAKTSYIRFPFQLFQRFGLHGIIIGVGLVRTGDAFPIMGTWKVEREIKLHSE